MRGAVVVILSWGVAVQVEGILMAPSYMSSPHLSFAAASGGGVRRISLDCMIEGPVVAGMRFGKRHQGGGVSMMAKKEFDKKYDKGFNDFRTSGSMPSIPGLGEMYQGAQSYVREAGLEVKEGDPSFDKRLTEEQEALKRQQEEGLMSYEEIKQDLIFDTAYVSILGLCAFQAFTNENTAFAYALGAAGSFAYAFLLTRTADRMGQSSGGGGIDPGTPLRFGILFFLIVCVAKNRETLNILPVLFGFFVPYKLASLKPAFTSLPPLRGREVRVYKDKFGGENQKPYKVEYGSDILGSAGIRRVSAGPSSSGKGKTQGSSAPLGKRSIASVDELYEGIKKGTIN